MSEKKIEKNALSLRNIAFSYENAGKKEKIIDGFSLDVEEGSFTTLLGSSGCGKTTLLRLISGFLKPDSGTIEIDGVDQGRIEPNKRAVGMVFQDYALFPHMTVRQNIEYGLKIKGGKNALLHFSKKSDSIEEKVVTISDKLSLHGLLGRYPDELSGGQQQRV
ncbi:MAG: ABC transporter ATP-binding protein, partial [Treponema sp.]|nr:ABC transporter ATP-binding protein [Treponema sp.]